MTRTHTHRGYYNHVSFSLGSVSGASFTFTSRREFVGLGLYAIPLSRLLLNNIVFSYGGAFDDNEDEARDVDGKLWSEAGGG